jgi:hypothetical protein
MAEEPNLIQEQDWSNLRDLEPDTQEFTANGKQYRVYSSVSIDRWEQYELLQVEAGLGRTFEQLVGTLRDALQMCNEVASGKPVFADLAIMLRDQLVGLTLIDERRTPAILKLCTLFINREGEDVRFIDEGLMQSKIDDWRKEGISVRFFFGFALRSIPGFFEAYTELSRSISAPRTKGNERAGSSPSVSASAPSSSATTTSSQPSQPDAPRMRKSGVGRTSSTSSSPSGRTTST